MSMIVVDLPTPEFLPVTFDLPGLERMDDAAFAAFCDSQPELRIEMDRNGNLSGSKTAPGWPSSSIPGSKPCGSTGQVGNRNGWLVPPKCPRSRKCQD